MKVGKEKAKKSKKKAKDAKGAAKTKTLNPMLAVQAEAEEVVADARAQAKQGANSQAEQAKAAVCPAELEVRTPARAKRLGWYVEFESRVTQGKKEGKRMVNPMLEQVPPQCTSQWPTLQHDGPNRRGLCALQQQDLSDDDDDGDDAVLPETIG